jgi:hypothetical protein
MQTAKAFEAEMIGRYPNFDSRKDHAKWRRDLKGIQQASTYEKLSRSQATNGGLQLQGTHRSVWP